jgi:hypothetical protein
MQIFVVVLDKLKIGLAAHIIRTEDESGENKNKMGGCRPEGHITDPRNTRMEEKSRRQSRVEVYFWGRSGLKRGCNTIDGRW